MVYGRRMAGFLFIMMAVAVVAAAATSVDTNQARGTVEYVHVQSSTSMTNMVLVPRITTDVVIQLWLSLVRSAELTDPSRCA